MGVCVSSLHCVTKVDSVIHMQVFQPNAPTYHSIDSTT